MRFLSIQSHVAYGHVGNSAAVFPLQRIGHEVWPVLTVNFSNHTGYGSWGGPLIPADDVRAVVQGIEDRGVLGTVDGVLSGYLGGEEIVDVVIDAVARVKAANPSATYTCDPVMGNARSGCFVAPAIPVLLRERVVPAADIITPNQFELGFLTGTEPEDLDSTLAAADAARQMGPRTVLVTSVERPDSPQDTIEMLAVTDDGAAWLALHRLVQIRECEAFARLQHSITNQLICFEHDFVVVFDDSRGLEHGVLSQVPFLGGDACWDKHERAHDAHQRETTDCPHRRPSVGGARTDRDVMETLLQNTKQVEKCKVLFRLSSRKSNKARVF